MQQWEYTITQPGMDESEYDFLNRLGRAGWQLCCVTWSQNIYAPQTYYFKRPLSTADKIFNEAEREASEILNQ